MNDIEIYYTNLYTTHHDWMMDGFDSIRLFSREEAQCFDVGIEVKAPAGVIEGPHPPGVLFRIQVVLVHALDEDARLEGIDDFGGGDVAPDEDGVTFCELGVVREGQIR